jgi:hypothetical protein
MIELGKKYRVTFEDCCVSGQLTGIALGWGDAHGMIHIYLDSGTVNGFPDLLKVEML